MVDNVIRTTSIVYSNNSVLEQHLANAVIHSRHLSANLLGNVDAVQSNVLSVTANVYDTYIQLSLEYKANDWATFEYLNANIEALQSAVNVVASSNNITVPSTIVTQSTGTTNVFSLGSLVGVITEKHVLVYTDGLLQPNVYWIFNSVNNSIQFKDATFPAGVEVTTLIFGL